jgi:CRP-like cAMP-binding protein
MTTGADKETIKKALAKFELFKWLTDSELGMLAALSEEKFYPAGFSIMAEGSAAKDLYMIEQGRVRVEMSLSVYPGLVQDALVDIVHEGDPFGWSAVIGSRVYTMTARAEEGVKVIAIDGEKLLGLFNKNPDIGFKVMEGLVEVVSNRVRAVKKAMLS